MTTQREEKPALIAAWKNEDEISFLNNIASDKRRPPEDKKRLLERYLQAMKHRTKATFDIEAAKAHAEELLQEL